MRPTAPPSARQLDLGLAILRVSTGFAFVGSGAEKLFDMGLDGIGSAFASMGVPLAGAVGPLVAVIELLGGFLLIAGLFTRPAARALAALMLSKLLFLHPPVGVFLPDGYEFVLTLLGTSAAMAVMGAGGWALDSRLRARRSVEAGMDRGDRDALTSRADERREVR